MKDVDLINEKWLLNEWLSPEKSHKMSILLNFIGMQESLDWGGHPPYFSRAAAVGQFLRTAGILGKIDYVLLSYEETIYNIKRIINEQTNNNQSINENV